MAEHAYPYFQLMEQDGRTYLLFNFDGTDAPAKAMDVETKEYTGSVPGGYSILSPTGTSVWNQDGIHAFLDRTGTYYTVLTPEELAQYGFTDYDSFNYRASNISVQESGVYIYLCRGGSREAGMYVVDYGVLLKKNLETGELTMIYEM